MCLVDSDQDVLRSRVFRIRLFGQDSLVGVWADMVIMADTPSWSQVKAIRAPLWKQKIFDGPSHVPYRYP